MDLILKFLHIPLLCTDCNPIMDCNASDLIMAFNCYLSKFNFNTYQCNYSIVVLFLT